MSEQIPDNLLYTEKHEWLDEDSGWVGITEHAQEQLGDVVFVEMPEVGDSVKEGQAFMVIESMKAVSDVYGPVDGEITEINEKLENSPEKVNEEPYESGRLVCLEISGDTDHLMDSSKYSDFLENQ
jgi:glycine cleavage system H protein